MVRPAFDQQKAFGLNGQLVFTTLRGGVVDQSYVRHLLPRLATKAGIEKRVHAHGLRHAFACELEREGATVTMLGALEARI